MFNYFRFRYRRSMRRLRRSLRVLRQWTAHYIDRHIWGKWHQVRIVRRFLIIWWAVAAVALIGLVSNIGTLQRSASALVAAPGGTYTEAAVGTVQNLNPVLPESTTASDINRLIFSGLTRYNPQRKLVGDLATSWDTSQDGKTYTFHLRHNVKWHDGVPFTSGDVVFTLAAIQNPDSRSPLASSWEGVKVDAKDDYTVAFTLPQPLNSFLDSTTVGIVPRHLLENVEPSQLREADFNQNPVGTGPFKLKTFAPSAKEVELAANPHYYLGKPRLDGFMFKFYETPAATLTAYEQHQVSSTGQVLPENLGKVAQETALDTYSFTLPEEQTLFFANGDSVLSDKSLRYVLSRTLDRTAISQAATAGVGVALSQPLLPGQIGYTNKYAPTHLDPAAAKQALDDAGWKAAKDGATRAKDGKPLEFKLVTLKGGDLEKAAETIQKQWAVLGIKLNLVLVDQTQLQQTYMRPRNFQMLLYGVNVGADPDVYSFWHSSQAKDPGVNLSGYNSPDADKALEAGRIKADPLVRQGKYDAFLKAWNTDAPAAVLYETGYTYGVRSDASGISAHRLVVPADRYFDVQNWTIRSILIPNK